MALSFHVFFVVVSICPSFNDNQFFLNSCRQVGRREGMVPKNGSLIWEGVATVVSVMAPPQQGLVDGDDPDSIFARAEYYLNRGCLEKAIEELDRLQG